jgi:hypothetical protein
MHKQRSNAYRDNVSTHTDRDNIPANANSDHVSTHADCYNVPANSDCDHVSTDADRGHGNSHVTRANSGGYGYCSASDSGSNG